MQRKTAKTASILMSLTMLAGLLAGCGGNNNEKNNETSNSAVTTEGNANSNAANADANKDAAAEDTSPITFSMFAEDPNPNWNNMQDEVSKELTKKTGVTLDAEFAVGDPAQKVALIATSGEYPDIISAKGDIGKLVDAGAVIDLTDLIDKYAPNIKKVLGDYLVRAKYTNEDQAIYAIPTWAAADEQRFVAGGGFELQHRVVKEAGYPEIRTVQDYENVIKSYLEKHPTDENGNKNIGVSLNADDWHMYISVTNPAVATTGGSDDGEYFINQDTHEAIYHFRRPEEKEYFRWLNHMNDIGLLDKESFVQKYDQYKAKVATGRVLGLIDQDWDYNDGQQALKTAGKFDQTYGHYPVTMSKDIKEASFWPTGFMGGYGISISSTNPDPVRTIKFLDYLASDEFQVLNNWGIEGKHYNVVDGKRVVPQEVQDRINNDNTAFTKETGIGFYWNMMVHYGDGAKDPSGNYYTKNFPEQLVLGYSDVEKETLAAYKATTWKDLFPKEDEFKVKAYGAAWNISIPGEDEVSILGTKMRDITWKRIPEAILAKPADFDKVWDAYMADLDKAGVKKMEEGYTKYVQDRVELWSVK
ncbi:ABC transporter substrate-binding protein [Paenibacillus lignilyticus]|uniref:ABC transporter substrate-binding protein n=1 Tax=Paenibacillus lignilyticus TaxID=1172615 RepID=A0ABS5CCD6_9BACL|nr:ABC transporter substrate-binding protein [Paenibacillus lignilyticus]MBP3961674.1 ABC transporter substrate-binding protein [Paenibacillus lignilyticus]MBP3963656.1 ABC transporter substrate-binding protein [Paenibacillus lignilyticus]